MTPCDYRHDCWHEDTCNAKDQALIKPGCWMPKDEGWKPEPDALMGIVKATYHSQPVNNAKVDDEQTYKTIESAINTLRDAMTEPDQKELF